jgi:hypothetical protein
MTFRRPPNERSADAAAAPRVSAVGAGRYQLIAQIAAAPCGPLWVARTAGGAEEGRVVLLRRIGKQPPLETSLLRKIARGAIAAMDVRDSRVAAALNVVVTDDEVAIVTEYVEGELLRSLQRRAGLGNRPIELGAVLRLALDLTSGAIAARDGWRAATQKEPTLRAACHGGLSPDSILVAAFGDPVLLDLGVAGLLTARADHALHPEIAPYRAPEQLSSGVIDERADVFTIGVILWELIANRPLFGSPRWMRFVAQTGELPESASEEAERARSRVLEMPIPRLDAVVRAGPAVPRIVADVVATALERSPGDRHRTLEALEGALEALGRDHLSTPDSVAHAVTALARTSIEARRLALASVTGRFPVASADELDSVRPTLPPRSAMDSGEHKLQELVSTPGALRSLETQLQRPPPLPKRRGPGAS